MEPPQNKRSIYLRQVTTSYLALILVLALFFIIIGRLGGILTNLNVFAYVIVCGGFTVAGMLILRALDGDELEEIYYAITKFRRQEKMEPQKNAQCVVDDCDNYQSTRQQNQDLFYPTMDMNRFDLGLNF